MSDTVDMWPKIKALREKYSVDGIDCFHNPKYRIEIAALWGIKADEKSINHSGVFQGPYKTIFIQGAKWNYFEIRPAQAPNGLWTYGYDLRYSDGGQSCGPSIFDHGAFKTLDALEDHAFKKALDYFDYQAKNQYLSPAKRNCARQMIEILETKNPKQLSLF